MDESDLITVGGHPALTLLNSTAQAQTNGPAVELLTDGPALLEWLVATGLLTEDDRRELGSRHSRRTLDQLARDVIELREWWRRGLVRVLGGEADLCDLFERLNALLADASTHRQLEAGADGVVLTKSRRWTKPAAVTALLAEAIADLIVSDRRAFIRNCENPTCTLWFDDRSKSHRRRWCSMAVCGNRAKARAHRDRQRSLAATERTSNNR